MSTKIHSEIVGAAGATGAVQFDNGSDLLGGDATNFFWDNTNKRLGIVSASPLEKLEVGGAALIKSAASAYTGLGLYLDYSVGSSQAQITAGGDGGNNRNLVLRATTGGTPNANQLFLLYNGSVGIGASPSAKFHVTTNDSEVARLGGSATTAQFTRVMNGSGQLMLGPEATADATTLTGSKASSALVFSNTANPLQLGVNTAVSMTLLNGGNVGIGTSAPGSLLDVRGSIRSSLVGNQYIATQMDSTSLGTVLTNSTGTDMRFNCGATEYMRILGASGNVGIGTSAPGYLLQVGTSSATMSIGGAPVNNGTARLVFRSSNSTTNWQVSTNDSYAGALEFMPSTAAGGGTFTTPLMFITTGGVGIGTTLAATSKLEVSGNTKSTQYQDTLHTTTQSGASITVDWSLGSVHAITLTQSITSWSNSNPVAGQTITAFITQGGSGSYTISGGHWGTTKWSNGTAPTLTTTVGKTDIVSIFYDGTSNYGFVGGLNH